MAPGAARTRSRRWRPRPRRRAGVAAGDSSALERHERPQHDLLGAGRDEAGVDELDPVDLAGEVQLDDVLADLRWASS